MTRYEIEVQAEGRKAYRMPICYRDPGEADRICEYLRGAFCEDLGLLFCVIPVEVPDSRVA